MTENAAYWKVANSRWDTTAVIFAVLVTLLEMFLLFAKPSISFFGKTEVVTQGLVAFGMITGALLWALIEIMTPARRHRSDLIFRFFGSFIVGFFVGAYLALYFNFGQYIIVPIYARNPFALFETFGIFFVFIVLVSNAAWAHNKTFIKRNGSKFNRKMAAFLPMGLVMHASIISGIETDLWNMFSGFLSSIISDFETLLGDIFGGFGNAITTSFNNWAGSLGGQGIWLPVIFVAVIAIAFAVGYFFLDAIGIERDVLRGEEDI
ncbi:MAG: hypothetical protein QXU18_04675 [Thermoplasmatales archaeon]